MGETTSRASDSLLCLIPAYISAILPDARLPLAIRLDKGAAPMLLPVHPLALVDPPVFPLEDALPLPLIVDEVALVLLSVGPLEHPMPMHLILIPFAIICLAIWPDILASPANLVLKEGPSVHTPIRKS